MLPKEFLPRVPEPTGRTAFVCTDAQLCTVPETRLDIVFHGASGSKLVFGSFPSGLRAGTGDDAGIRILSSFAIERAC